MTQPLVRVCHHLRHSHVSSTARRKKLAPQLGAAAVDVDVDAVVGHDGVLAHRSLHHKVSKNYCSWTQHKQNTRTYTNIRTHLVKADAWAQPAAAAGEPAGMHTNTYTQHARMCKVMYLGQMPALAQERHQQREQQWSHSVAAAVSMRVLWTGSPKY